MAQSRDERLFAARSRLTELGIATRFTARGDALRGELPPRSDSPLLHPLSGERLTHVTFSVGADARLSPSDPPAVAGLVGPDCLKLDSLTSLYREIDAALRRRAARVKSLVDRLGRLGFECELDPQKIVATIRVDLDVTGVAVLEASDGGLVARHLIPAHGDRTPVSLDAVDIDLETLPDRVDVELFLVSRAEQALGGAAHRRRSVPHARDRDDARDLIAGLLPPASGETWIMDVRVEEDDGHEVRYRGVNIGGGSFGAPRVLPKPAFESAYIAATGGYRMLVRVLEVGEDFVVYQRLDAGGELVATPKRCPMVVFLSNFTPEAAAY